MYRVKLQYSFKAGGELWNVVGFSPTAIEIIEDRCNGQEDCHMMGEFQCVDGKWSQVSGNIVTYSSVSTVQAIIDFLNQNGSPSDTNTSTLDCWNVSKQVK